MINIVSSLGLGPAKKEYNFEPGLSEIITYKVFGVSSTKNLAISVKGDLAQYVKFDKDKLIGPGEFAVILELPDKIDTPGKNKIYISVSEEFDEELAGTFIGTAVKVNAVIYINVPYPGKYLDVDLASHNANIGEPVKFDLDLISKGVEDVTAYPKITVISDNRILETLVFKEREILSQENIKLRKFLLTENYNPGTYTANAIVLYGGDKPATSETEFKIGELIVDIINYSKKVVIDDKTQAFSIEIESGWNSNIDDADAKVVFLDSFGKVVTEFKTTSTDLIPWQKKSVLGYFDSSNFTEGFYDANITISYSGEEQRKTSSEIVMVEFIKKPFNIMLLVYVLVGLIFLIAIIFLIWKFVLKKRK